MQLKIQSMEKNELGFTQTSASKELIHVKKSLKIKDFFRFIKCMSLSAQLLPLAILDANDNKKPT